MASTDLKQKLYKILVAVFKNFLAFAAGGILGLVVVMLSAKPLLERIATKDVGLGIIALAPAMLLIYGIIFASIGGIIAIIAYNVIRFIRRRAAQKR